jgi:hypothetical protein
VVQGKHGRRRKAGHIRSANSVVPVALSSG